MLTPVFVWIGIISSTLAAAAAMGWALRLRSALRRARRKLLAARGSAMLEARLEQQLLLETELRAQLEATESRAELALGELSSLSYAISHDLRAPLRSIDGFSQALVEDYADQLDGVAHDYLRRVRANARRLNALVEDLLMLSRLVRAECKLEPVDLGALADEVIEELRKAHPERRVAWEPHCRVTAHGDRAMLRLALQHLLGNAWKFTGPRIHARIGFRADRAANGEIVYAVSDNGVGFDMNYAGKLFGAFQRMHSPEEFAGNGIGLAAAQRIVHRHGGRIWAESAPDSGTAFFFTLGGKSSLHPAAREHLSLPAISDAESAAPPLPTGTHP